MDIKLYDELSDEDARIIWNAGVADMPDAVVFRVTIPPEEEANVMDNLRRMLDEDRSFLLTAAPVQKARYCPTEALDG